MLVSWNASYISHLKYLLLSCFCIGSISCSKREDMGKIETIYKQKTLTLEATSDVSFRFVHPEYADMFWNEEHMINGLITYFNLSANSSNFEIVDAIARFHKTHHLQVNDGMLQNNTHHSTNIMTYNDWYSKQCGEHADHVAALIRKVSAKLHGIHRSIRTRYVSMDGHQTMEYFDNDHGKSVFVDPDPGTDVLYVTDGNSFWASVEEIKQNPKLILNSKTIATNQRTERLSELDGKSYKVKSKSLRREYYKFMITALEKVGYFNNQYFPEDRDMIFRLPKGATLKMVSKIDSSVQYVVIDKSKIPKKMLRKYARSARSGDYETIVRAIKKMEANSHLSIDEITQAVFNNRIITNDNQHGRLRRNTDEFGWYITVTLPFGNYDTSSFNIPLYTRSITTLKLSLKMNQY